MPTLHCLVGQQQVESWQIQPEEESDAGLMGETMPCSLEGGVSPASEKSNVMKDSSPAPSLAKSPPTRSPQPLLM